MMQPGKQTRPAVAGNGLCRLGEGVEGNTEIRDSREKLYCSAGWTKEGGGVTRAKGLGSPGASWNHKLSWETEQSRQSQQLLAPLSKGTEEREVLALPFAPFSLLVLPSPWGIQAEASAQGPGKCRLNEISSLATESRARRGQDPT